MNYWIITDNTQRGPLTAEELSQDPALNADTPVWHEGLPDWTKAALVPELAAILAARAGAAPQPQQQPQYQQPYQQPPYQQQYQQPYYQPFGQPYGQPTPDQMPSTYLVWAILATICCCIPTGVVAIIYSSKVSPAFYRGDYAAALRASERAQLWIIISFVAALIWAPFSILFSLM